MEKKQTKIKESSKKTMTLSQYMASDGGTSPNSVSVVVSPTEFKKVSGGDYLERVRITHPEFVESFGSIEYKVKHDGTLSTMSNKTSVFKLSDESLKRLRENKLLKVLKESIDVSKMTDDQQKALFVSLKDQYESGRPMTAAEEKTMWDLYGELNQKGHGKKIWMNIKKKPNQLKESRKYTIRQKQKLFDYWDILLDHMGVSDNNDRRKIVKAFDIMDGDDPKKSMVEILSDSFDKAKVSFDYKKLEDFVGNRLKESKTETKRFKENYDSLSDIIDGLRKNGAKEVDIFDNKYLLFSDGKYIVYEITFDADSKRITSFTIEDTGNRLEVEAKKKYKTLKSVVENIKELLNIKELDRATMKKLKESKEENQKIKNWISDWTSKNPYIKQGDTELLMRNKKFSDEFNKFLKDNKFSDETRKLFLKESLDYVLKEATPEEENEFHKKLDDLVHETFGHSSDEKEQLKESKEWEKRLKDGSLTISEVNISDIKAGDTIIHKGDMVTVGGKDIKKDGFMGITIFGDSYKLGREKVKRVNFKMKESKRLLGDRNPLTPDRLKKGEKYVYVDVNGEKIVTFDGAIMGKYGFEYGGSYFKLNHDETLDRVTLLESEKEFFDKNLLTKTEYSWGAEYVPKNMKNMVFVLHTNKQRLELYVIPDKTKVNDKPVWISSNSDKSWKGIRNMEEKITEIVEKETGKSGRIKDSSGNANNLNKFIGKTVEVYSGTTDKILGFGDRNDMYKLIKEPLPHNPMGYHIPKGIWTAVERRGEKLVLNPVYVEKLAHQKLKESQTFKFDATPTKLDEIDASFARAGVDSTPDFNNMTIKVSGDKTKIDKIVKFYSGQRLKESSQIKNQLKARIISCFNSGCDVFQLPAGGWGIMIKHDIGNIKFDIDKDLNPETLVFAWVSVFTNGGKNVTNFTEKDLGREDKKTVESVKEEVKNCLSGVSGKLQLTESKELKGEELYAAFVDAKENGYRTINKQKVDGYTAAAAVQVLDKVNKEMRKKLLDLPIVNLVNVVWKVIGK
jgi:hypothetical protein